MLKDKGKDFKMMFIFVGSCADCCIVVAVPFLHSVNCLQYIQLVAMDTGSCRVAGGGADKFE